MTPARPAARAFLGLAVVLGGSACDLEDWTGRGGINLTGQNAFVVLQVDPSVPQTEHVEAALQVLQWQAEGGSMVDRADRFEPDPATEDFLVQTSRLRESIRPERFSLIDLRDWGVEDAVGGGNKTPFEYPDLDGLSSRYVVPRLDAIPVRNQGGRGTCAAFTGIGHLEYAVMRASPGLPTVDLSEQRFYFNSRPECQATGCSLHEAGSNHIVGFRQSIGSSQLDIPLEVDCPYNPRQGDNELQVPQAPGCSRGVVRVVAMELAYQPADILRVLTETGLPVPYASPLSSNYFSTSGMITARQAGPPPGDNMHAAGHAYLIVGYQLLPNMPEEGGMCFIIKNSWGTGWGAGGYACMTLAWMEAWRYENWGGHPVVVQLELADELLTEGVPDDPRPPDNFDSDTYDDETLDDDALDDTTPIPDPEPEPDGLRFTSGWLRGPDARAYRMVEASESSETGDRWHMRADLRGDGRTTNTLVLEQRGIELWFDGDLVGETSGGTATLCTGRFDPVCSLRYNRARNALYIEFVYDELRRLQSLPQEEWRPLIRLPSGAGLEILRPESLVEALLSPLFIRLQGREGRNRPLRIAINRRLEITSMRAPIGSLRPDRLALCTGGYRDSCSLLAGRDGLMVLPGWGGL
jgi:hypothetical protein